MGMSMGYSIGQALHEGSLKLDEVKDPGSHLRLPPMSPDLRYLLDLSKEYLQGQIPSPAKRQTLLLDHYLDQTLLVGPQTERVVDRLEEAVEAAKAAASQPNDEDETALEPETPEVEQLARQVWEESRRQAAGSGGLKRSLLVPFFCHEDLSRLEKETAILCKQTHPDQRCVDASLVASRLLRMLIADQWHGHRHTALCLVGIGPTVTQSLQSAPLLPLQALSPNGYVVTSLQASYRALLLEDPPPQRMIALWQCGGPSATLGMLAGAFLGARYGLDVFPQAWFALLPAASTWRAIASTIPLSPAQTTLQA